MEQLFRNSYQKFGDLTTGKRKIIFTISFLIFIFLVIISDYLPQISQNILFWVFSTIAQCLIALVALMGMLGVFKFQIINRKEEHINSLIKKDSNEEHSIEKYPIDPKSELETELENLKSSKSLLRDLSLDFVIYTLLVAGIDIILLTFSSIISQSHLGVPVLFFILFLFLYSLFLTIKFVAECFEVNDD